MIRDKYVGRNNRSQTNNDLSVKKRRSKESDSSTEDGDDTTAGGGNSRVTFGDYQSKASAGVSSPQSSFTKQTEVIMPNQNEPGSKPSDSSATNAA